MIFNKIVNYCSLLIYVKYVSGLCGNFNMVLLDELKTPQGLVEGTASSFGNSWKSQSNCPDSTEKLDDPCSYNTDSGKIYTSLLF